MSGDHHVLHVDSGVSFRGGQRQLLLLASGQVASGLGVTCLVRSSQLARSLASGGVAVTLWRGPTSPYGWAQLWRSVRTGPTLLHAHDSRSHGALRVLAPRRLQSRLVIHRRIDDPPHSRPLTRWKYRAGHIISVSHAVDEVMKSFGVPSQRRSVLYSAAALPPPVNSDQAERSEQPALRLLSIGALVPHKGHAVLIRALERMTEPAHLCIVGAGVLRRDLEDLAHQLGVGDRVRVEAFVVKRANELLFESDAYVQPSRTEGLGTAVLDAMLAGLPVVASGVGGLVELVGEGHGWIVPPEDPAALAEVLDQLATDLTTRPREVRSRVERARRRATTRHSAAQMLAGVCSVYDGLV